MRPLCTANVENRVSLGEFERPTGAAHCEPSGSSIWAVALPLCTALAICLTTWCAPATAQASARGSGKSLTALIEQLKPPHTLSKRLQAAEALAVYGEAAVEQVMKLLRSEDSRTRYYACVALTRLGPCAAAAVPDLMAIAADPNEPSQCTAVIALGRIGPAAADAVPVLFQLACEDNWELRNHATRALSDLGTSVVPALVKNLQNSDAAVSQSACAVLRRMGPKAKDAVPLLVSLVAEAGEELRNAIFLALGEIGSPALNDLTCMLRHEDADVRRLAVMALSP